MKSPPMKSKAEQAMEMPLHRLVRGTILFHDFVVATSEDAPPRWAGLLFLAEALNREAVALRRLYYGETPDESDSD